MIQYDNPDNRIEDIVVGIDDCSGLSEENSANDEDSIRKETGIGITDDGDIKVDIPVGSSLQMYFNDISRFPLLTVEEERRLTKQLREGTAEEKREAFVDLCNANYRLVIKIARHYIGHGMPLEDVIQEGNIGLMYALEKFDPSLGYKLSTYATWWIRQRINRAVPVQGRLVNLPVHAHDLSLRIKAYIANYEATHYEKPSLTEIAEAMGATMELVTNVMRTILPSLSLDAPVSNKADEKNNFLSYIIDETELSVEDRIVIAERHDRLYRAMDECLTEREKNVLIMRFGLEGDEPMQLKDIGKEYKFSRERARQIEKKALEKMRVHLKRIYGDASYL